MRDAARAAVPPRLQQNWQRPGGPQSSNPEHAAEAARAISAKIGAKRSREAAGLPATAAGAGGGSESPSGASGRAPRPPPGSQYASHAQRVAGSGAAAVMETIERPAGSSHGKAQAAAAAAALSAGSASDASRAHGPAGAAAGLSGRTGVAGGSQGGNLQEQRPGEQGALVESASRKELAFDDGESVASDGAPLALAFPLGQAGDGGTVPLEELSKRMARARRTHDVIRQRAKGQFLQYGGAAPATTGAEAPDEQALQAVPGQASFGLPNQGLVGPDRGPSSVDMSMGSSMASTASDDSDVASASRKLVDAGAQFGDAQQAADSGIGLDLDGGRADGPGGQASSAAAEGVAGAPVAGGFADAVGKSQPVGLHSNVAADVLKHVHAEQHASRAHEIAQVQAVPASVENPAASAAHGILAGGGTGLRAGGRARAISVGSDVLRDGDDSAGGRYHEEPDNSAEGSPVGIGRSSEADALADEGVAIDMLPHEVEHDDSRHEAPPSPVTLMQESARNSAAAEDAAAAGVSAPLEASAAGGTRGRGRGAGRGARPRGSGRGRGRGRGQAASGPAVPEVLSDLSGLEGFAKSSGAGDDEDDADLFGWLSPTHSKVQGDSAAGDRDMVWQLPVPPPSQAASTEAASSEEPAGYSPDDQEAPDDSRPLSDSEQEQPA